MPTSPVACPSSPTPASGVRIDSLPSVPGEGSTQTFTCIGISQMIASTCGSDGRWSPDPQTYVCPTLGMDYGLVCCLLLLPLSSSAPPVTCDPPGAPFNGTVNTTDQQSYTEGSTVTFQCDPGLFPLGVMNATCTIQGQTGVWVPYDPGSIVCRTSPGEATPPKLILPHSNPLLSPSQLHPPSPTCQW